MFYRRLMILSILVNFFTYLLWFFVAMQWAKVVRTVVKLAQKCRVDDEKVPERHSWRLSDVADTDGVTFEFGGDVSDLEKTRRGGGGILTYTVDQVERATSAAWKRPGVAAAEYWRTRWTRWKGLIRGTTCWRSDWGLDRRATRHWSTSPATTRTTTSDSRWSRFVHSFLLTYLLTSNIALPTAIRFVVH